MKRIKILLIVSLVMLTIAGVVTGNTVKAQGKPFDGVSFNILTFTGPQIAEPLQRRAPDFEKATGASISVITVPNADLYQKMLTDASTGTNSYNAYVFAPQWVVDFAGPGYLQPLDDYVKKDDKIKWDDISPFFRNFSAMYGGKIYTIPLDGDFHMVYYRTDVFAKNGLKPPTTWQEYLDDAKKVNGQTFDGTKVYGSCISKARAQQAYWWIISIAAGMLQSQGTGSGAFFDTTTMKPLLGPNEATIKALDIYKETSKYGPPNEATLGVGDTRSLWTDGKCALTLDWGDIGPLAVAPGSKVADKTGAVITPGYKEVLDRASGKLVPCDKTTCPYAVDGVNYAPFASFGGWSGGINAASPQKVKDAAYAFLSYMSQPEQSGVDVTIGKTGFNPYRISHFKNLKPWTDSGMSEAFAKNYLGAIQASLNSPNMVLDLRIPQNQKYEQVILDQVSSSFLAGELDDKAAAQAISDQWEATTNDIGRDAQLKAYIATLGIQK